MNIDRILSFIDYHAVAITAIATIVLAIATIVLVRITIWYAKSTYQILKEDKVTRKINDIGYQLDNVYLPMKWAIEQYKDQQIVLRRQLNLIESKNIGTHDEQVTQALNDFFGDDHSVPVIEKLLDIVKDKVEALKEERQTYLSYKV